MRAWPVSAIVLTALACTTAARADPVADAEKLFREGNTLVAAGKFDEACPKLAESQRLDPAVGTEFNLADCDEHLGKLATAFALFTNVQKVAHAAGKFEREKRAKERADALAPKLPHVKLVIATALPGLAITIDGLEIDDAKWVEPFAIDPGAHTIVAAAPNRTPWQLAITTNEAETLTVPIPELVDPNPPPIVVERPKAEPAPGPHTTVNRTQRTVAFAVGQVGIAGIAVGVIAGSIALSKKGSANDACPSSTYHFHCPTQAGTDDWNSARTAGNVSTAGFIVGGVALATAVVLWITSSSTKAPTTTAWAF